MVQIIIYDTNYEEQQFIQKKTREYLNKKDREYEILTIDCVEELFQRRESNQEAVILLDIDMEGLNRNKMAECMRVNTQQNVSMIFITNHAEYVFDAVQYQPFRYIRKHFIDKELPLALTAAMDRLAEQTKRVLCVKNKTGAICIDLSRIMYFELEERKITAYGEDSDKTFYCSMKKLEWQLEQMCVNFVKIHSGCMVNPYYVDRIEYGELFLKNGRKLLISRRNVKKVKEQIYFYWGNLL